MDIITTLRRFWASLFGGFVPRDECVTNFSPHKSGIYHVCGERSVLDAETRGVGVLRATFARLAESEGGLCAYQDYDNQLVTLGPGFGAKGLLPKFLARIPPEKAKHSPIAELGTIGEKLSDEQINTMKNSGWARKWVCWVHEEPRTVFDAAFTVFLGRLRGYPIPQSVLDDPGALLFIAHLIWWYPTYVPAGLKWPENKGEAVAWVLEQFLARAAKDKIYPSLSQLRTYAAQSQKLGFKVALPDKQVAS